MDSVKEDSTLARTLFSEAMDALARQKKLPQPKRKTLRQLESERDRQNRELAAWQDKSGNALRSAP